jgi:hypothetical protein
VSLRDDARSRGNVATVAIGLGAAALAGATVLILSAPKGSEHAPSTLETGPEIDSHSAAWMMRGTF